MNELENDRNTLPPGSDTIDDPAHAAILATIESGLDLRLQQIEWHIGGKIDKLTNAVHTMATEATRANKALVDLAVLKADVRAIKARCAYCSVIPDCLAEPAE